MTLDKAAPGAGGRHHGCGWRGRPALPPAGYGADPKDPRAGGEGRTPGRPLELRVRGYSLSLRKEDAGKIEVEVAGT